MGGCTCLGIAATREMGLKAGKEVRAKDVHEGLAHTDG